MIPSYPGVPRKKSPILPPLGSITQKYYKLQLQYYISHAILTTDNEIGGSNVFTIAFIITAFIVCAIYLVVILCS
jgi:hypothetical protein